MNQEWRAFVSNRPNKASETDSTLFSQKNDQPSIYNLTHLGVLSVSGRDSETFLQGQATCDITKITQYRSSVGAFCNPKGRVASTFTILKDSDTNYLLLLPVELLSAIQQRLQRYVLRADVKLEDVTDRWCTIGVSGKRMAPLWTKRNLRLRDEINEMNIRDNQIIVRIHAASERYLVLALPDQAMNLWSYFDEHEGFSPRSLAFWMCHDISDGLPFISPATSEAFVPQMINLDNLDAISFDKGCYTGQEVVARTHYLGTLKRRMYRMSCTGGPFPKPGAPIHEARTGDEQPVGTVVLAAPCSNEGYSLLAVLQVASSESTDLRLHAKDGSVLTRQPLSYAAATR